MRIYVNQVQHDCWSIALHFRIQFYKYLIWPIKTSQVNSLAFWPLLPTEINALVLGDTMRGGRVGDNHVIDFVQCGICRALVIRN